ncbi:MAG: GTPase [Acidimicrobiales bacterium]
MPANLSPEYKAAEAEFRQARTTEDRLTWLREMLRTVPKHKGTEHLQADIKTRIKELTEELAGPRKGGARTGPATVVRREGAGQVALLGPPNSGKSALHARLTGSRADVEPYPFTTHFPQPGMLPYEDIGIQVIDLPPVSDQHPVPWLANALQPADGCLLVVDLSQPDCVEQLVEVHDLLAARRVSLTGDWAMPEGEHAGEDEDEDQDPFAVRLATLLVATKADLLSEPEEELAAFRDLTGHVYPAVAVSTATGHGVDEIGPFLFDHLGVVRVYTKAPGRPPDLGRPFIVGHGQSVYDVAELVHKELAVGLRFARLWRGGGIEGRQVGRDHPVEDGDILELHA